MPRQARVAALCAITLSLFAVPLLAISNAALERLAAEAGGAAHVSLHRGNGTPAFVRMAATHGALDTGEAPEARAAAFFRRHAEAFGIGDPARELALVQTESDAIGNRHLAFVQSYRGIPVFAAMIRAHFDRHGDLRVVNGALVPRISVDIKASVTRDTASARALAGASHGVQVLSAKLVIYDPGLGRGRKGTTSLAWQVETGNGRELHELVFVDAHRGNVIDRLPLVHSAMTRRALDGSTSPWTTFWSEGDAFPTGNSEADTPIRFTKDAYDFYFKTFGRDSYDGAGATMESVFNLASSVCPNAFWMGAATLFCPGSSSDDVVVHEWTHAVTQHSAGLLYLWEPGALNESFSDVFGETVDLLNVAGTDAPAGLRTDGQCSDYTPKPTHLQINSPASLAGSYETGRSLFGPQPPAAGTTGDLVLVDDGAGATSDACESPFVNAGAVAGKIAVVDRGTCSFVQKTLNAQANGAIGVLVVNSAAGGDALFTMSGSDPSITIPSQLIGYTKGTEIKTTLASEAVNASLMRDASATDASYRWILFEDSPGFNNGIRDMWSPNCYGDPAKRTDAQYSCSSDDDGSVHSNSGVANHAYALLVDGGTYNGQAITGIGLTKAAHIYYRALTTYHTPTTGFAEHADGLEQACADLAGASLTELMTGAASTEVITAADCTQVAKANTAVEMRLAPSCDFTTVLAQSPPAACAGATTVFSEDFESGLDGWSVSNAGVFSGWTPRDWTVTSTLPKARSGSAAHAVNIDGACSGGTNDQTGVLHLDSPSITLPAGIVHLAFDHSFGTAAFDGGNVKISVNGGAWQLLDASAFVYNAYNAAIDASEANPLHGETVFSGSDAGAVESEWGRSIVRVSDYANAGDTIRLRFSFGQNGCLGGTGWFVDDVRVYACPLVAPAPSVSGTISASGTFVVSGAITYTIVLTNSGTADQPDNSGNELDDVLPPQLEVLSATASAGSAIVDAPANSVAWNGVVPAGDSVTITIVARAVAAGTVANEATIRFDADGNGSNESSAVASGPGTSIVIAPAAAGVAIPTLGEWALLAMAMLLAMLALRRAG